MIEENFKTEKNFLDIIQTFLEQKNCKCWREVIPDECKKWTNPFSVDLIFYREDLGYIAVEGKNINTTRQGQILAKAVEQIQKYKTLTFFDGTKINKWCIAAPFKIVMDYDTLNEKIYQEVMYFIKYFLKYKYNISILEFNRYSNSNYNRLVIDSYTKNSIYIK